MSETTRRIGRPLADWLLDLVADHARLRARAGKVLVSWWQGLPDEDGIDDELTPEEIAQMDGAQDRFASAVRTAVVAESFPTVEFVNRLCGLLISLQADWLERCERVSAPDERTDALLDQSTKRMTKALAFARIMRVGRAQATMSAVGMASFAVLKALDVALLASEDALLTLLEYEPKRRDAYEALARIGPPAVSFAPRLLEHLDEVNGNHRFEVPAALGSIGRNHPPTVAAVIDRLNHPNSEIRNGAIATLGQMGMELAELNEEVMQRLLAACDDESTCWWAIGAVASVGPSDVRVLNRVIKMMAPCPPVIGVHEQNGFRYQGDLVMFERGYAIRAAAKLTAFPEQVVPVLVDALDTFEEFDPDEDYYGEHSRIFDVLKSFGPAAAPAVPKLSRLLTTSESWSDTQLKLIAAIGPAASELLPQLLKLREDPDSPLDGKNDLDAAILAVGSAT